MNDLKPKFEYTFQAEFFRNSFLTNVKNELRLIERMFNDAERDEVKLRLNAFALMCYEHAGGNQDLILKLKILFTETLHRYAQNYDSIRTYRNLLVDLQSEKYKSVFSTQYPYEYKYLIARTYAGIFNCKLDFDSHPYSLEGIDYLNRAKYYILKIYTQYLDNKIILSDNQLHDTLTLYIVVLTQLSRWSEPFHFFKILETHEGDKSVLKYHKSMLLEILKDKTCLNYNALLLLEIIDLSQAALKNKRLFTRIVEHLKKINQATRKRCRKLRVRLPELRNHKTKSRLNLSDLSKFEQFCYQNSLFLNEHVFFCDCKLSAGDTLMIETSHAHTKIKWCKKYSEILDLLKTRFYLARNHFYQSKEENPLLGYNISFSKTRSILKNQIRNELLISSFKECYSILDAIGIAILDALEIDHESKTRETNENQKASKIYFLNMWDYNLIEDSMFEQNPYILTLYSIAKDLNHDKYAALKSFKKLRNAMEHNILFIKDSPNENHSKDVSYISKESLVQKCLLLLTLTKSAIFTYTYFVRRESKLIDINLKTTGNTP